MCDTPELQIHHESRTDLACSVPTANSSKRRQDNGIPARREPRSGWLSDHPLSAEFHHEANAPLTPDRVAQQSNNKVIWICEVGHTWPASPNNRVGKGSGCPYCSGQRVSDRNRLSTNCPDPTLLQQWDYARNAPPSVSRLCEATFDLETVC